MAAGAVAHALLRAVPALVWTRVSLRASIGVLLCVSPAQAAVELAIHFTALQRLLAEQVFTQDGRRFVRGTPRLGCNYAYLEHPEVHGDGGRLGVHARFSGRSAWDLFGRCVGLGDAFDVWITAAPYYSDGAIRLKDVRVESRDRDGFYIRRVRAALADTLRRQFVYRIAADAKKLLEEQHGEYRAELSGFGVPSIRVTSDALVLALDFTLAVK